MDASMPRQKDYTFLALMILMYVLMRFRFYIGQCVYVLSICIQQVKEVNADYTRMSKPFYLVRKIVQVGSRAYAILWAEPTKGGDPMSYTSQYPLRRLAPAIEGEHCFFGYYDLPAFSADGRYHLCHRVEQMTALPRPDEPCRLALIHGTDGSVETIGESRSWNFQQGAMLQWLGPDYQRRIIYNDYRAGDYVSVVRDLATGRETVHARPVAAVSTDGRYGLSVNFARIYDFRPGYGYCNRPDPYRDLDAPAEDGIFLLDLTAGTNRLLVSYAELLELFAFPPGTDEAKLVINHITFNPSGTRFVFLLRYLDAATGRWHTAIGSADLQGEIHPWTPYGMASHYYWRDDETLLIYMERDGVEGLYELRDLTSDARRVYPELVDQDIHCSYSPDRRFLVGDTYPNAAGRREILLIDREMQRHEWLASFHGPTPAITDIRTDLHVRWSPNGRLISFDSIHEGFRGIYALDLTALR